MSVPTSGETFAQLLEHLRKAQECAATMAHLRQANDDRLSGLAWLAISELIKQMVEKTTKLAMNRMH
jgi:hypothetical protein